MILINLLPHREAARKRRKDLFNLAMGASLIAGGLVAGSIQLWLKGLISSQEHLNGVLTQEIKKLDQQIQEIASLESEISGLRARQQAVEDLQADRNAPVHLLAELVRQMPDGVNIKSMVQNNQTISLQGTALTQERVSELLRNFAYKSTWFSKPELLEIQAGSFSSGKEQRRTANFTMRVQMLRASEVQKLATEASAANARTPVSPSSAPMAPVKP